MSCATGCEGRRGRATARGRSRPRLPRDRMTGGPCRSCRLTARLALALGDRFTGDDAIDPLLAGLVGHEVETELVAHHCGQEAAHRVRLPAGGFDDCRDGCSLPAAEHLDHPGLLRTSPAGIAGFLASALGPMSGRGPSPRVIRCDIAHLRGASGYLALLWRS